MNINERININDFTPHKQDTCSQVKSEENGCEHTGRNPARHFLRQFHIDGEVIPRESPVLRCDYLVLDDTEPKAYYIELKGSNISRAIDQVENSVRSFQASLKGYTVFRRIIYRTGTHSVQSSKALRWKFDHPDALIKSRKWTDDIS